jgi:MFS family permease
MSDYRNVLSLLIAACLLQVAGGLLGVVTPLDLEAAGSTPVEIGFVAAAFAGGFMLGAMRSPDLIARIGHIRTFSAAAALAAASCLLLYMQVDPIAWSIARFVMGAAIAAQFAAVESWITDATPKVSRGGVLGLYHVFTKFGLMAGPFLALGLAPLAPQPYMWAALFLILSLIPVTVTRRDQPAPPTAEPLPIRALIRLSPAASFGAFVAGVANSGLLAMLPLYAISLDPNDPIGAAAVAAAAAWIGGLFVQWPAGRLSDHLDRRLVVAGLCALSAAGAVAMVIMGPGGNSVLALLAIGVWGAGSLSYYGVCVAHAADRSPPGQTARVLSGLLFIWAVGSVIGPPLAGAVIEIFGGRGLFGFGAFWVCALMIAMGWRSFARTAPRFRDRFQTSPTSTIAITELDPRSQTPVSDQ